VCSGDRRSHHREERLRMSEENRNRASRRRSKTGNLLTFHNQVFDPSDTSAVGRDQGT
jgi:hypothetical protein